METNRFYTSSTLSEHLQETPEGFLVCYDVPIARTGEYKYKTSEVPIDGSKEGIVTIQRDDDEVFSDEAIKSFEGKPVTIEHPDDFVTPMNWKGLAHGVIQNVRRGLGEMKDLLMADLCLMSEEAIKLVKAGLRQVSCGYDAKYEQIGPGIGKQLNIIGNHLALVTKGRAGNRCAITDSDNIIYEQLNETEENMSKKTIRQVLKSMFPKLNLDSVKDEDLELGTEESSSGDDTKLVEGFTQKALEAASEAVGAAKEAKEAAEKVQTAPVKEAKEAAEKVQTAPVKEEEEAHDDEEEMGTEEEEEEGGDLKQLITSLIEKVTALEAKISELTEEEGDDEEDEEGEGEENEPEEDEDPLAGQESEEEIQKDEDETEEEKKKETEDNCGFKTKDEAWQDTISRAEILYPGISINRPKNITRKSLEKIKRDILTKSLTLTKDSATVIKPLLKNKKISKLTRDSVDTIFTASSEMMSKFNDSKIKVRTKPAMIKDMNSFQDLHSINQRNKEYWKK